MYRYLAVAAVRYPLCCALIPFTVFVLCSLLPFILALRPELDSGISKFEIRGNAIGNRMISDRLAEDYSRSHRRRRLEDRPFEDNEDRTIELIYVANDEKNLLTAERLYSILNFESWYLHYPGISNFSYYSRSVLPEFFPNYPSPAGRLEGNLLAAKIKKLAKIKDGGHNYYYETFDKWFNGCHLQSMVLRSKFKLRGYALPSLLENLYKEIYKMQRSMGKDDAMIRLLFYDNDYEEIEYNNTLFEDIYFSIGVFISVFLLTWLQTGSLIISICSCIQIILTFGASYFVYRICFGIVWMGVLNFLSLFIIMGIGADDTFVLVDAWKQSAIVHGEDMLEQRMIWTLSKSTRAMFATSFTSTAAFFANTISLIPPLKLFGLFTGFMVLADFLLTITFLPPIIIIDHKYIKGKCCSRVIKCFKFWCNRKKNHNEKKISSMESSAHNSFRPLERFFMGPYSRFMVKYSNVVVLISVIWISICLNFAFEVKMSEEYPLLLPRGTNQGDVTFFKYKVFRNPGIDYGVWTGFYWGIVPEDNSYVLDPSRKGTLVFDKNFDMSAPNAQRFMLETCDSMLKQPHIIQNIRSCFMYGFRDYAKKKGFGFPVPAKHFHTVMLNFTNHDPSYSQFVVFDDAKSKLLFVWYSVTSTINWADNTPSDLRPVFDDFESFMNNRNQLAAATFGCHGISRGFQNGGKWTLMSTLENIASTGIRAMILSLVMAACVLLVTTMNLAIVIFAMLSLCGIVLTIVTLMVWLDITIGVMESICLCLLVGLSVDYTIHIANAYVETPKYFTRQHRSRLAISHIGISIFSGVLTTSFSGFFLFPTTFLFFTLFGHFLVITVFTSICFAIGLFMALCFQFGPENNYLNIKTLCVRNATIIEEKNHIPLNDLPSPTRNSFVSLNELNELPSTIQNSSPTPTDVKAKDNVPSDDLISAKVISISPMMLKIKLATLTCILIVAGAIRFGLSTKTSKILTGCSHYNTIEIRMPSRKLQPMISQECIGFSFPTDCVSYITGFEIIDRVNGSASIQRVTLFKMFETPSQCPFSCPGVLPSIGLFAEVTMDMQALQLPDDFGFTIESGAASAMQIYFNNPPSRTISQDEGSGIKLHLSFVKPKFLLELMGVGFLPGRNSIYIPINSPNYTISTICTPKLRKPITVIAYLQQAGKIAKMVMTQHLRNQSIIGSLGKNDPYDFNSQKIEILSPSEWQILQPGDNIKVTCIYDSTGKSSYTRGGFGDDDERCISFLVVFPSDGLQETACFRQ